MGTAAAARVEMVMMTMLKVGVPRALAAKVAGGQVVAAWVVEGLVEAGMAVVVKVGVARAAAARVA